MTDALHLCTPRSRNPRNSHYSVLPCRTGVPILIETNLFFLRRPITYVDSVCRLFRMANIGITVRRASVVIGKSSIDFTSFCRIWTRLVASPTRIPPPRSCPEILLEDSNPRPIIERRSCRPGINQSGIEEHCVSTVHRVVFAAASSPITRITEVESSEPKFSNPPYII